MSVRRAGGFDIMFSAAVAVLHRAVTRDRTGLATHDVLTIDAVSIRRAQSCELPSRVETAMSLSPLCMPCNPAPPVSKTPGAAPT
jgi:hypothetical protein